MTVFRCLLAGLHLKFRKRIEDRRQTQRHIIQIQIADTVQHVAVVVRTVSRRRKTSILIKPYFILLDRTPANRDVRSQQGEVDELALRSAGATESFLLR